MALGHWAKDYLGPKEAGGGSGGGGVMAVPVEFNESTEKMEFKRTWKEMHDAFANGQMVFGVSTDGAFVYIYYIISMEHDDRHGTYGVNFNASSFNSNYVTASAATENDYPSFTQG